MSLLFAFYAFALGAIVGSFLNVVIHRVPRDESIVSPPSHCPLCGMRIRWFDNIPVISYLALGGRCRGCRRPITARYPLIELANALFYLALYYAIGVSWFFIPLAALISMTIALIYIDLDIQILPDVIDLPGVAIGLGLGALHAGALYPDLMLATGIVDSIAGALLGGGLLLAVSVAYKLVRKIEGMGLGDVKMLAMVGAVLGWRGVIPLVFLASVSGAAFGIALGLRRFGNLRFAIPFGVFLGLAFLTMLFFGNTLFEWYRSLLVV
jgi:leader peptidase (prepilin peptidase)/N-methyltransferase